MKKAFITGVTGQDGSYLSEFLLSKGYEVHGLLRRASTDNTQRLKSVLKDPAFHLHYGDMSDSLCLTRLISIICPDEIYNLAAQSHVGISFDVPEFTADIDAIGILRILDAVRILGFEKKCRIYQASSSELFGKTSVAPQNEETPFHPYSPYAIAKQYAHWIVKEYREAYNMFCCCGILFNHESERRGEDFVTRKISLSACRIAAGKQDCLYLGNLDAKRDFGYAKDFVECMWLMLQNDEPKDYVIATGENHSVREFAKQAFKYAGIDLDFCGSGSDEVGIDLQTGRTVVRISDEFFRPTDVDYLLGDPAQAIKELGFDPKKTDFQTLVKLMVESDMEKVKKE